MNTPRFWYRDEIRPKAALLRPLGGLYAAAGRLRRQLVTAWRAPVPVICVGNLVAGGVGKTPVAIALARLLRDRGVAAEFLTRGYGGKLRGPLKVDLARHDATAVGDEPPLLAAEAPTWVCPNRAAGARAAVAAGAGLLIMDDGHQNPGLHKDLALVVVDGEAGFGNGLIIPAGPLREPVAEGLARADAVVLMGEDRKRLVERLASDYGFHGPVLRARLVPESSANWLRGTPVVAFAGIGRPDKFFALLEGLGARLVARFDYPDHHRFDPDEILQMAELARDAEASLITTTKDFVRLPESAKPLTRVLPIQVVWQDPKALDALLAPLVGSALPSNAL